MKTAILFLFYKSPAICRLKISSIRRMNPGVEIFGLFGGDQASERFFAPVRKMLDDCWSHPIQVSYWKYINIDCVIADWYLNIGRDLRWDALFIYEWDLHTLVPIESLAALRDQSQFLLYHRELPIATLMQRKWYWVHREEQRSAFAAFERALRGRFGPAVSFWGHEAVFYVMPRSFLEASGKMLSCMPGMVEYRLPSLAAALGHELVSANIPSDWAEFNRSNQVEVVADEIEEEIAKPDGCRCFHPVYADFFLSKI
jgi:hypothetical protein